jgi:HSP20 family molecular chaperone IbpA
MSDYLETHVISEGPYLPEAKYYAGNEDGKNVVIYIVAPGYTKEDFNISVTKDALKVTAAKKKDIPVNLYAQGFSNTFRRRVSDEEATLPITGDNTSVTYVNGILRIAIEIPVEMHPTTLEVK